MPIAVYEFERNLKSSGFVKLSLYRSLPVKEGVLSTELDEAGNPDSTVQTYVDEKGRTRVSRVRGMGVRMTRDLQWNLYLMKDVQNRQTLGELKDESVSASAESLVNSGDAEFQRLMTGDKANLPESLPRIPFKDIDSSNGQPDKSTEDNPDVMPPVSSIQITFNSNEIAEDEDLDLFKDLVGDEAGQHPVEKPEELKPSSGTAAVAEEKKDDEFEWEDGDCQRGKEAEIGLQGSNPVEELAHRNGAVHPERESHMIIPTGNDLPFGGDSDAEMALAIQESLAEHDRMRAAQPGVYPDSEYTGPSDDSDTGDSGESEVEWEDGSGAVAVPAVGYTVAGPCPPAATKALLLYSHSTGCVGEKIFADPHASSVLSRFPSVVVAPSYHLILSFPCVVFFLLSTIDECRCKRASLMSQNGSLQVIFYRLPVIVS